MRQLIFYKEDLRAVHTEQVGPVFHPIDGALADPIVRTVLSIARDGSADLSTECPMSTHLQITRHQMLIIILKTILFNTRNY